MALTIRRATAEDAQKWLDLVQTCLGSEYPAKSIYDPAWIAGQLSSQETWVAASGDKIEASISFLTASDAANPVANLGRNLFRSESTTGGSAEKLLKSVNETIAKRKEVGVVRIAANDKAQQVLFEKMGYVCVGYQPLKHMLQQRVSVLYYVNGAHAAAVNRTPLSESLPQVNELALAVLPALKISSPTMLRDSATGYPLQSELKVQEATIEDFSHWRVQAESCNAMPEVSGRFNLGLGLMRMPQDLKLRAFLGEMDEKAVAGLAVYIDEHDRCARITEALCIDDLSIGALLAHALRVMQEQLNAIYTEVDILASAPRLLKSAEALGFVPVAYLPAFYSHQGRFADVVKMVKLNLPYAVEGSDYTEHARSVIHIIDRQFEDQRLGLPTVNLLRPLSVFSGLGDGELRKIARLFVQRLYRAGDRVFAKGDAGEEAYVVLRGKVSVQLESDSPAVMQLGDGKLFGELAFLDATPRAAYAVASQPSILLIIKREAFTNLLRREPNIGVVVMRNLARDLSHKLRSVNEALSTPRKPVVRASSPAHVHG